MTGEGRSGKPGRSDFFTPKGALTHHLRSRRWYGLRPTRALRGGCGSCGSLQPMLPNLRLRSSLSARRSGAPLLRLRKRVGLEPLPPVSVPFRLFLSRLTCRASARRRSLGAKIPRKLPAHRCFAVSAEQIWAEARRSPQGILLYFQGLERSIGPNLPAQTGRCSSPTRFNLPLAAFHRGRGGHV